MVASRFTPKVGRMPVSEWIRTPKGRAIIKNMATTATNVYWSKDFVGSSPTFTDVTASQGGGIWNMSLFPVTYTPEPPHECEVIQRMSEAWRARND